MPLRVPTAAEVAAAREAKRQRTNNTFEPSGRPLVAAAPRTAPPAAAASSSASSHAAPAAPAAAAAAPPPPLARPPGGAPAAAAASTTAPTAANNNPNNAIIVSRRQQGNPVLKGIRNVPWQFGETSADYLLSDTTCCLFLSLRYHLLHPDYLTRRVRELSASYTLRVVLLYVDSDDAERPVLEVTRTALAHDCTTLLAWSASEAARYLETLRSYARKPADIIKERSDGGFLSQLGDCLTSVRPLNKTDVATLHASFGSLAAMMKATQQELALCPGLGERKVHRLRETFSAPFVPHAAGAAHPR